MAKSYYATLGISSMATADEIRAAYRRLAKTYHPDRNPDGSQTFRRIQEAYNVLGDADKRRRYEQTRHRSARPSSPFTNYQRPEPLVPAEKGSRGSVSPVRPVDRRMPTRDRLFDRIANIFSNSDPFLRPWSGIPVLKVSVNQDQAQRGGTVTIMIPVRARCPECLGEGGLGPYDCRRCAGQGVVSGEVPASVAFPPGITGETELRIALDRVGIPHAHLTVVLVVEDRAGTDRR